MNASFLQSHMANIFIAIISLAWISIFIGAYDSGGMNWGEIVHGTGELAFKLLIFTIFISLAQKICRIHFPSFSLFSRVLPLRKYSGIFAFLIVASHAIAEGVKQHIDFSSLSEITGLLFNTHDAEVFGTISFLIMLPLFLTSTLWAMKKMGAKAWKNLQRFTHVAFVFAVLHVALLDYFIRDRIDMGPLVLLGIYMGGYIYLFVQKSKKRG